MKVIIPSEFVQPEVDVNTGDTIRIIEVKGWISVPQDPDTERFQIVAELPSMERKKMSVNKTSLRKIMEAWGDESDDWKGKNLKVKVIEQQAFGELKKILYVEPEGISKKDDDIPIIEEDEN